MTKLPPKLPKYLRDRLGHLPTIGSRRITPGTKLSIVTRYLAGKRGEKPIMGFKRLARVTGVNPASIRRWVKDFEEGGVEALGIRKRKTTKKFDAMAPGTYRSNLTFDPRDIATIRYAMTGLTNTQVAAFYGVPAWMIKRVREGRMGGPIATPLPTPAYKTQEEANQWFIHKAIKIIDAYVEMMQEIEKKGDRADIEKTLQEADHEASWRGKARNAGSGQRGATVYPNAPEPSRVTNKRRSTKTAGKEHNLLSPLMRTDETPDPWRPSQPGGQDSARRGDAARDHDAEGLLRRKR